MIKREDVIFDPTDPRAVALEGKRVLASDYYDMRDAKKCVYEKYEKTELPFFCDGEYFTFIAQIPEATYRPFKNFSDWMVGEKLKCCGKVITIVGNPLYRAEGYTTVRTQQNHCFNITLEELFKNCPCLDGTPFGTKEEK